MALLSLAALLSTGLLSLMPNGVTAFPTATGQLLPRSCEAELPTLRTIWRRDDIGADVEFVSLGVGDTDLQPFDSIAQFQIPAGSYGCQLQLKWPAGAEPLDFGNPLIDVFAVDPPPTRDFGWTDAPQPKSLFGTVDLKSEPDRASVQVINSAVCQPTMAYRLTVSDKTKEAAVIIGKGSEMGLQMVYNC